MTAKPPKIGMRIRRARERRRMTQDQLADALGVARPTISNWEGDKSYPQNSIGALEYVLDVDLTGEHEQLPEIVAQHQDDPRVMEVWNMTTIQTATKLSVIRHILADDGDGEISPRDHRVLAQATACP
jgi:transcriptional regulator with XRE-family HTH domain